MIKSRFFARIRIKLWYLLRLEQRLKHWDDERYLKLRYAVHMGERLDLVRPKTFGQKLQWLKLHDRRPSYPFMVDKFEAKKWVTERIGESYIVPNLGVWNSFDDIDFDALPDQFVLKCTHDSGGLVICSDRTTFNRDEARLKIEKSLSRNYFYSGREWSYLNVQPRVLAEVYLPTWTPRIASPVITESEISKAVQQRDQAGLPSHSDGVVDYKFYCFHGEPKFLYVSQGLHDHETAKMDFLNLDWTPTDFIRSDYLRFDNLPPMPTNLENMLSVARELSSGIPFLRVDLFEHTGRVLFSENTFYPASGMMHLKPDSADFEIGQLLDLSLARTAQ